MFGAPLMLLLVSGAAALNTGGAHAAGRRTAMVGAVRTGLICATASSAPAQPSRDHDSPESQPAPESSDPELPAWFDNAAEPPVPLTPPPPPLLSNDDLVNTKWTVQATPRDDSWLNGPVRQQEFTLLADSSVVWGASAGGFGTGGRWTLKDGMLEVIRTTPLGLVTGRDYYMAQARVDVNKDLQFELNGIIRSYNAIYPVMVIADFVATRLPGRFIRDVKEDS